MIWPVVGTAAAPLDEAMLIGYSFTVRVSLIAIWAATSVVEGASL